MVRVPREGVSPWSAGSPLSWAWPGSPPRGSGWTGPRGGATPRSGSTSPGSRRPRWSPRPVCRSRSCCVNTDPIEHEWLVGDEAFHERHRRARSRTTARARPRCRWRRGETKTTTVTFDQPGDYRFICHLPGHEAYGMVGVLRVLRGELVRSCRGPLCARPSGVMHISRAGPSLSSPCTAASLEATDLDSRGPSRGAIG